jgi:hypothetical protein
MVMTSGDSKRRFDMDGTTLADRLQEKVAGVCLIVGALLLAPATYFEYSQGLIFWSGAIGLLLFALLVPGLLGVARLLRQGAPRLSVGAGLMATSGCVSGATFQTALLHEWAARTAGTPEALMAAIMEITEGQVFPVLVILGILFPISLLTLSAGLFRTGVVPTWVAALLGIGAIAFPVGHIGSIQLVQHLAETVLLVPLVWLGLHSLTWATPRGVAVPATA